MYFRWHYKHILGKESDKLRQPVKGLENLSILRGAFNPTLPISAMVLASSNDLEAREKGVNKVYLP